MSVYTSIQVERFWNNVAVGNRADCWPWKLSQTSNGYGQLSLRLDGVDRVLKAHKVAWEIRNDQRLKPNVRTSHSCDNKLCCNPGHVVIYQTKLTEHYIDGHKRSPRGEKHGRSKLTERQAIIIKYKLGALTTREIADSFKVAFHTVWDIRKGITWRHI